MAALAGTERKMPRVDGLQLHLNLENGRSSVLVVDMREAVGNGPTMSPIRIMMNHAPRGLLRRLRVPAENLIGEGGKGFRYVLSGMTPRILIAAECVGDAKWFIEKASTYAREWHALQFLMRRERLARSGPRRARARTGSPTRPPPGQRDCRSGYLRPGKPRVPCRKAMRR
jgi:hypothetical protein